jgi:hypothetical protein
LARLEGSGPQLLQLLLRGVVGRLEALYLGVEFPRAFHRPRNHERKKLKLGADPK